MRKSRTISRRRGEALARPASGGVTTLVIRNITIGSRRTTMRLEPAMWDALEEICQRENLPQNELCENIDKFKKASSLTAAVRVFIATYFRAAATEEGHISIGHGTLKAKARDGRA